MTVVRCTTELPWDAGSAGGAVARGRAPGSLVTLILLKGVSLYSRRHDAILRHLPRVSALSVFTLLQTDAYNRTGL